MKCGVARAGHACHLLIREELRPINVALVTDPFRAGDNKLDSYLNGELAKTVNSRYRTGWRARLIQTLRPRTKCSMNMISAITSTM